MKRIICLCILVALCLGVLTLPAMAANSGSCGDNVTWKLEAGILTISGSGEMTHAPWLEQKYDITEVIIEEGVTSVCDGAFEDSIIYYATIPASVTKLGERAFANCTCLERLYFHGDLPEMEFACFSDTYALAYYPVGNTTYPSFDIPQTHIYCYPVVYDTHGTWGDNITWEYEDGVLTFSGVGEMKDTYVNKTGSWLLYDRKATKVVVEEGITALASDMLRGFTKVTAVSLPEGLVKIGNAAFEWCFALETINIPSTVKEIGMASFNGCYKIKEIVLPDGLESISNIAFIDCKTLETISIPSSVNFIGDRIFEACPALKTIYFYGDAPEDTPTSFGNVTATVYYPRGNDTWARMIRKVQPDTLTWKTFCANNHTPEYVVTLQPQCTVAGLSKATTCQYCDTTLNVEKEIPATGHTFGEWEIVDSSEEGVLVERSCETCGHIEQKLLDESYPPQTDPSDAPTNPEDTPTEATDAPTEPAQLPTDPTQPDITVKEESKTFPWVIIVIAVAAVGAAAAGVILGKKRK